MIVTIVTLFRFNFYLDFIATLFLMVMSLNQTMGLCIVTLGWLLYVLFDC